MPVVRWTCRHSPGGSRYGQPPKDGTLVVPGRVADTRIATLRRPSPCPAGSPLNPDGRSGRPSCSRREWSRPWPWRCCPVWPASSPRRTDAVAIGDGHSTQRLIGHSVDVQGAVEIPGVRHRDRERDGRRAMDRRRTLLGRLAAAQCLLYFGRAAPQVQCLPPRRVPAAGDGVFGVLPAVGVVGVVDDGHSLVLFAVDRGTHHAGPDDPGRAPVLVAAPAARVTGPIRRGVLVLLAVLRSGVDERPSQEVCTTAARSARQRYMDDGWRRAHRLISGRRRN